MNERLDELRDEASRPVRRADGRCLMCRRDAYEVDPFCSAVCSRAWWGTSIAGDPVDLNASRDRVRKADRIENQEEATA